MDFNAGKTAKKGIKTPFHNPFSDTYLFTDGFPLAIIQGIILAIHCQTIFWVAL